MSDRAICLGADVALVDLLEELRSYPMPFGADSSFDKEDKKLDMVVPLRLMTRHGTLSFISTTMVFGTPVDVTSSELAIESFFPADATLH